jgi:hypothetical protein
MNFYQKSSLTYGPNTTLSPQTIYAYNASLLKQQSNLSKKDKILYDIFQDTGYASLAFALIGTIFMFIPGGEELSSRLEL